MPVQSQDSMHAEPLVLSIPYQSPQHLFQIFAQTPWNLLIESADGGNKGYGTNRYSYILIDPFEKYSYCSTTDGLEPLRHLRHKTQHFRLQSIPAIPPFQGGIAGYMSYDLAHLYQAIPRPRCHRLEYPEICMGFYDLVCSFDHWKQKAYLVSSGFPARKKKQRLRRAEQRLDWLRLQLDSRVSLDLGIGCKPATALQANFTKGEYIAAVKKIMAYIRAGDIFQANLSQRFSTRLPHPQDYYRLYQRLSLLNPAPFSAFLHFGDHKIISSSPERFIRLQDKQVETRPIKGTRKRCINPAEDALAVADLLNSAKDFAENTMIVDLMRNDLSIVCEDDSVLVTQFCGHEIYPTVHHLVSVIVGQLQEGADAFDLLSAAFPGGSVTGAPKIRAMQIIAELEPCYRGPYCGSVVLIGFDGNMDSSIIIRSYVIKKDCVSFHAGGAIVLDSDPRAEYEETLIKSLVLQQVLLQETHDIVD